ncbi:MAG: hypothetical protein JW862_02785 [Anaerolineales bacterium]|nr:hypothetical protein [Anaerolineales bacterium]
MLILVAILISLVVPFAVLAIGRVRSQPGYQWLLSVIAAGAVWVLVVLSRLKLPQEIMLIEWYPASWFQEFPALLLDQYSWPYALAIVTISLAVLLTDAARTHELDANAWAATLALSGLGLLSVLAGNPLTLLLTWAIMDLVEAWVLLERVTANRDRERVVISFSVRVAGMVILVIAGLQTQTMGQVLRFTQIPPQVGGLLLLASGLRLGVLPPHQPFLKEPPLRRGLGTMIRLLPVAASLILLTRTASVGIPTTWKPVIIALAIVTALYSTISWLQARDELDGRPFWILGMGSLALLAAVQVLPQASLAWGLAILFSGSLLFLRSLRHRSLVFLPLASLFLITGLPLTPGAVGLQVYPTLGLLPMITMVFLHGILLAGYLKYSLQVQDEAAQIERWAWAVYPAGLVLLLLSHLGISIWTWVEQGIVLLQPGWWVSFLLILLIGLLWWLSTRRFEWPGWIGAGMQRLFSLNWAYAVFWWIYRVMTRLIGFVTRILEGEGGILWALLLLMLLIAVIIGS